jgi:hypothetical protein
MRNLLNEILIKDIFEFLVNYFQTPERIGVVLAIKQDNKVAEYLLIGEKPTGLDREKR